jgi:hypothetical protein
LHTRAEIEKQDLQEEANGISQFSKMSRWGKKRVLLEVITGNRIRKDSLTTMVL